MKKIWLGGLLIMSLVMFSFTTFHKFYVSVTQIEYVEEKESLQIITRIFIDDIEDLLQTRYDKTIILGPKKDSKMIDLYLEKYFNQKFKVKVNGKSLTYNFLGKKYEEDLMICFIEIENLKGLKSIEVTNELLMDMFEEQQNIVHVKKDEDRKSLILEKGKDTGMLKFSE